MAHDRLHGRGSGAGGDLAVIGLWATACAPQEPTETGEAADTSDTALPYESGLILWNATVIDEAGRREQVAVQIYGDVIITVVPAGNSLPEGAIDATGRFIVPGLVDSHVHLAHSGTLEAVGDTLDNNLRAQLLAGVTQVVDLGGPDSLFNLRDRLELAAGPTPRIWTTGPFLTTAASHPCEGAPNADLCVFVETPESGSKEAAALATAGADGIKVALADAGFSDWGPTPRLDLDVLSAITAGSLPVWAHVDTQTDATDALTHGVTLLAHPPFDAPLDGAGAALLTEASAVVTTVSAFANVGRLLDGSLDPQDASLELTDGQRSSWQAVADEPDRLLPGWAEANVEWMESARGSLDALESAGVLVLPGSDAGYYFVPHGRGLHDELAELVALGLDPHTVLVRATWDARQVLGLEGGRVAAGEPADLLLLADDPDLDVGALSRPDLVIVRGQSWTADAIQTADLLPDGTSEGGDACLEHADCATGACDALSHACADACAPPYEAADTTCGATAWCMPADAAADPQGVCRDEATCSLDEQDCGPEPYDRACLPYDEDTNACWYAGPRVVGQTCSTAYAATSCEAGLYCSPIDAHCYALCEPGGLESCARPSTCVVIPKADGAVWFGLCLSG